MFLQAGSGAADGQVSSLAANPLTTRAGDLLVAAVTWDTTEGSTVSIADSDGNTWTAATAPQVDTRNSQALQIFYAPNIAGGADTVTVVPSPAAAWVRLIVHEVAGADPSAPLDQTAANNAGSGSSITVGPVTTSVAGEYLFTAAMDDGGTGSANFSAGAGYTLRAAAAPGDSELASADQVQGAAGSVTAVWTLSASSESLAQMATFLAAGASGPSAPAILSFSASPSSITAGQSSELSWVVSGNPSPTLSLNDGIGTVTGSSAVVSPAATTTYTLTAQNANGSASAQATVTVERATGGGSGSSAYPLKASANGRYLVDQNGRPFLVIGDAPHSLIVNLSTADAAAYLRNRAANGFNTLWVESLCNPYCNGPPSGSLIDGVTLPFTNTVASGLNGYGTPYYDFTTPNPDYWAHVDLIVSMAATNGIEVLLDSLDTGGWLDVALANGTASCQEYGQFLGARYASYPNIIWITGNDFQPYYIATNEAVVTAVTQGIEEQDGNHLETTEMNYYVSYSLEYSYWLSLVSVDSVYSYYPTYAECLAAYNAAAMPVMLEEANYEYETNGGTEGGGISVLRRQEYWSLTGGALAGHMYGNHYTWTFDSGWQNYLNSPGVTNLQYFHEFFTGLAWYNLVPDQSHTFVTSGYGTYSSSGYIMDSDYSAACLTPDGTLGVVYTPVLTNHLAVALSRMAGPVTARWFDPSAGSYSTISGSPFANTGTHTFTPPGFNSYGDTDWVLLLQANPSGLAAPSLAWSNPADIVYGTPLGDSQLNATATFDSTNVSGTFTYAQPAGTILNAGPGQTLSVTFTPADTSAFSTVSTSVTLNVDPLAVVLTGSRGYDGTAAAAAAILSVVNAVGGDVVTVASGSGTLAGANVGAWLLTGPGTLALGGPAAANYTLSGATGTVTINPAPLTITALAQSKVYGTVLSLGTTAFSVSGALAPGQTVTAVDLTANGGTAASAPPGIYVITPSAATGSGGFLASNYNITYKPAALTVHPGARKARPNNSTGPTSSAQVIAASPASGAVTGDVIRLGTPWRKLVIAKLGNGSVAIGGQGVPGRAYAIEYTTGTLPTTNWLALGTVTADALGTFMVVDTAASGLRFYRATSP